MTTDKTIAELVKDTAANSATLAAHLKTCEQRQETITKTLEVIDKNLANLYDKVIVCAFRIGGSIILLALGIIGSLIGAATWLIGRILMWW